jgi:hypothetical protein
LKLIIHLASHDPSAEFNFIKLASQRRDAAMPRPRLVQEQLVEKKENNSRLTICDESRNENKFNRVSSYSEKVKVEFIAHGVGSSNWIKCMPEKSGREMILKEVSTVI